MTRIEEARAVLARWRKDTTPLPWEHSNETEGAVVHRYEAHHPEAPQPVEEVAQTWEMNDARLIIGTAGNSDLLDAIDGILARSTAQYNRSAATELAAAIIAADVREVLAQTT